MFTLFEQNLLFLEGMFHICIYIHCLNNSKDNDIINHIFLNALKFFKLK